MRSGADDKRIFRDDLALENAVHAAVGSDESCVVPLGEIESRVIHAQRREDAGPEVLGKRLPRNLLDDPSEEGRSHAVGPA